MDDCALMKSALLKLGGRSKAPVKVGREQEVEVIYKAKVSDQSWPRVMRRTLVRVAAKR